MITITARVSRHTPDLEPAPCSVCALVGCTDCTGSARMVPLVPAATLADEDAKIAMYCGGMEFSQGVCLGSIVPAVRRTLESALSSVHKIVGDLGLASTDASRVRVAIRKVLDVVAYAESHREDVIWQTSL